MFKKEITSHLLITLAWLIIISLLRWSWQWNLIWLWLGAFIGTFLIDLDHFIYLFFTNPHELTSQRAQRLWEQKHLKELIILTFDTSEERIKLAFHNVLFQLILLVLCFFVLTSTGNLFGAGLVMAMTLHLLKDELHEWWSGREERLKEWLFWPIKMEVSLQNQKVFLIFMLLLFVALNFFLI
jgi:hypothetical protein